MMTARNSDRRGALWGLAFIAFLAAALAIVAAAGEVPDTPGEIASYYKSHDELEVVAYLIGAAGFCLLPFLGALRAKLRRAEGERDDLATLAFGAGLVFTAMIFVFGAAVAAVATATQWDDKYIVDATTSDTVWMLGFFFWTYAGVAGGVLAGAASVVGWRTRALPRWLAIAGFVAAVAGFVQAATWGFGAIVAAIWILLTCLVMIARPREQAERAVTTPAST
jgi:hypothetical protein